ncbi:MAG: hypothetical protein FJ144_15045 [Deltaproteobacteria bacterium]|nr:hypothetical protein [Deltaproteobacteria bacterium]
MSTTMGRLERDTVWEGDVHVIGDVLVAEGTTLTVRPGTRIRFAARPRWACSVFWRSPSGDSVEATMRELCALVVCGRLEIEGTKAEPVRIGGPGEPAWGGMTCFGRGEARFRHTVLEGAPHFTVQTFDDAFAFGEDSCCVGSEFGLWAWGTSRLSWTRGTIAASRGSVVCCEGARAHLVEVEDESGEGVAATDWSLIRVERGCFRAPRKHCVVARHRSWVRLAGCRMMGEAEMDLVRLDDARVEVAA